MDILVIYKYNFILQARYIARIIIELGILRILFLFFFIPVPFLIALIKYPNLQLPFIILILLIIHFNRKDINFIYLHVSQPKSFLVLNYLLFSIPFTFFFALSEQPIYLLLLLISIVVIPLLSSSSIISYRLINLSFYLQISIEWMFGLRKYFLVTVLSYLLVLYFAFIQNYWGCLLSIINLAGIFSFFYMPSEHYHLITIHTTSAKDFLSKKLIIGLMQYFLLTMPLLIIFFIFKISVYVYLIYLLSYFLLILSILLKYGTYPNRALNIILNSCFQGLFIISLIYVHFFVVFAIIFFIVYQISLRNLNQYLYD